MSTEIIKFVPSQQRSALLAVRYDGTKESEKSIREWIWKLTGDVNQDVTVRLYTPEPIEGWDPGTTRRCLVIEFEGNPPTRWMSASIGMYVTYDEWREEISVMSPRELFRDWMPAEEDSW